MPKSAHIQFLNLLDRPDLIPTVAKWYYEEWGRLHSESSYEKTLEKVSSQSNRDRVPLHVLAVLNREVVGVAQLKFQENKAYPKDTFWVGGVFVSFESRGLGIGAALVGKIIEVARTFGAKKLYLQTEKIDGGVYTKCGFNPVERVVYHGLDVLIMMVPLE
jgi:GNAT superfamily N-acetyltransferase